MQCRIFKMCVKFLCLPGQERGSTHVRGLGCLGILFPRFHRVTEVEPAPQVRKLCFLKLNLLRRFFIKNSFFFPRLRRGLLRLNLLRRFVKSCFLMLNLLSRFERPASQVKKTKYDFYFSQLKQV